MSFSLIKILEDLRTTHGKKAMYVHYTSKTTTPFYRPDGPTHDPTKGILLEMSVLGISTVTLITSCVSAQLHLYADLHSWSVLRRPPCSMSHGAHSAFD